MGFVGVAAEARDFLTFWCERLSRTCIVAPENGYFVDQKWVDFVPALFENSIIRDPSCNVAWWNLAQRNLEALADGDYLVDGIPLTFFHFSGYDYRAPHLLTKHQGPEPWVLLSDRPDLARLCDSYRNKLLANNVESVASLPYGWGVLEEFDVPYDSRMRHLYAGALLEYEAGDALEEPKNPFSASSDFLHWLNASVLPERCPVSISRYLQYLHATTPEVSARFPDIRWSHGLQFLEWMRSGGAELHRVDQRLIPDAAPSFDASGAGTPSRAGGVNLAGYLQADDGIGEVGRSFLEALDLAGIPSATIVERTTLSHQGKHDLSPPSGTEYDTSIVCVNADRLLPFRHDVGSQFFANRRTIGVWWWELEEPSQAFAEALTSVNEVWTGSSFVRESIASVTEKPVRLMPQPVRKIDRPQASLQEIGFPEGFVFLFMFDFLSVVERKNPQGVIQAFTSAFEPDDDVSLVIKSVNGHRRRNELEKLRYQAREWPNIRIIDRHLSAPMRDSMIASADCFVSLHRSEGFGLSLAESMGAGVPVIATGYSGNMDFMDEGNSFPIRFSIGSVPLGCDPYPEGARWATPDIGHAADVMRYVWEHPAEAHRRAELGRQTVRQRFTTTALAEFLRMHLVGSHRSRR